MEALGLNLGFLFVQIFNFLIVFVILRALVYKPILGLLDNRRKSIAQGLEDARIASEARESAEKDAEEIIAKAQAEASEKIREATERAETSGKEILAQAEQEVTTVRKKAVVDAEQERDRILADMRGQVAALAMAAAQKLIGESLDENRQRGLIDEFFSGVKSGSVVVLDDQELHGQSAEITSALPLTEQEKEVISKEILSKTGSETTTFKVDPNILGGLVIKIGDKVLDNSVSGQLESLRQNIA